MAEIVARKRDIREYRQDHANANVGTERQYRMLDNGVDRLGLARSIVAAADDSIPAGNTIWEVAVDRGIKDVIEVETDGSQLVVVKRTDWDSVDHPNARRYAYLDNQTSHLTHFSADRVFADIVGGVDFDGIFNEIELGGILGELGKAHDIIEDDEPDEEQIADVPDIELTCPHCGEQFKMSEV